MDRALSIYICDDDLYFAEKIKQYVKSIMCGMCNVKICTFDNGDDLLHEYEKSSSDAVFLDIDIPDMNGFQIAEALQKNNSNAIIVFITSYEDKVYQSWTYQPFWFVRKNHLDDLAIVLPKMVAKIESDNHRNNHIFKLKAENCIVDIDIGALIIMESVGHDIEMKYICGTRKKVRCKISDVDTQLKDRYIVRIQKGILVNCRYISKITSREVILTNGGSYNISRKRIEEVKAVFQKYVRSI